jgi:hypothetical protein
LHRASGRAGAAWLSVHFRVPIVGYGDSRWANIAHSEDNASRRWVSTPADSFHAQRWVRVDLRPAALDSSRFAPTHEGALVDPHGQAASRDQPCVVLRPVPDSIDPFRLATLAFVLAHLPAKYRESTQFLPKLTEAAPRPLRVNVTPWSDRFLQQRPSRSSLTVPSCRVARDRFRRCSPRVQRSGDAKRRCLG